MFLTRLYALVITRAHNIREEGECLTIHKPHCIKYLFNTSDLFIFGELCCWGEPHTNDNFVRWLLHGKTVVKSGLPHTTVSWFKHYNTRQIMLNPYKCVCDTTETVLRLQVFHIWSYGGSCHELVNREDY